MNTLNKLFKNSITALLLTFILVFNTLPVSAIEAPPAPPAPEAPTAPSTPEAPSAPTAPTAPTSPSSDDSDEEESNTNEEENDSEEKPATESSQSQSTPTPTPSPKPNTTPSPSVADKQSTSTSDEGSDQVGDTTIDTGDANNTGTIMTDANNNLAQNGSGVAASDGPSVSIANSGNGTGSDSEGSATIDDTSNTFQDNSAAVNNDLALVSETGDNRASDNVGNSSVTTGDANVSGTVVTTVNTNADGIMVSEFNVEDDHMGDLVLDFAANCVSGCAGGDALVKNVGNGSDSTNTAALDQTTTDNTFQNNDAAIGNDLTLIANSGENYANDNTGGNSEITTGDANVSANVLTFANNNLAGGNVVYGVVNIYGELIGDIIFPEEALACCGGNTTVANVGNGSGSTNTGDVSQTTTDNTFQTNDATIDNVLVLDANTGDNRANDNTNGNSTITTGDSNVTANVLNVANSNVAGDWWLVLVNQAGQWIGKIMGAPDGATYAGSQGTEFAVNADGEITAINNGNGSGSTNTAAATTENNTTTVQNNNANIVNNLNLTANTGKNSTSDNTGGSNAITTGDATIMANLVNFVNNNFVGGGNLFVTVVNVFGNWVGDFVAPGQKKEQQLASNPQENGIGGTDVTNSNTQSQSSNANTEIHSDNTQAGGETTLTTSAAEPTATPTPTPNGEDNGSVLAFGGTFPSGPATFESVSGSLPDAVITPPAVVAGRQVVRINLAWLILILPCVIIVAIMRRVYKKLATAGVLSPRYS